MILTAVGSWMRGSGTLSMRALLALAAALPATAEIRDVTIEIDPAAPNWQEEVTITVRGESSCSVELFHVSAVIIPGTGRVLPVELEEACGVDPPTFAPFEVTVLGDVPSLIADTGAFLCP